MPRIASHPDTPYMECQGADEKAQTGVEPEPEPKPELEPKPEPGLG